MHYILKAYTNLYYVRIDVIYITKADNDTIVNG